MSHKNSLAEYTPRQKRIMFDWSISRGDCARRSDGTSVPLVACDINDVEYLGGMWRIQTDFTLPVTCVRDKYFVLQDRMDITEKNGFEYYRANRIGENCYGRYVMNTDEIVGHAVTGRGDFWAYGTSIPAVRAFLAIAVYDMHMDTINGLKVAAWDAYKNQNR